MHWHSPTCCPSSSWRRRADRTVPPLPDVTRDDWRIPAALATRGTYEVSTRDPTAELTCRVHGGLDTSVRTWIDSSDYRSFEFPETAFGLGIGALTPTREQAAVRLGEIVAAAGAVAHLPTTGAQVPDFDVGLGGRAPKVQLVSGLSCEGSFSLLKRFSSPADGEPIPLSELAQVALEGGNSETVGVVMVAETTGLVGAWLRRSPGVVLISMYLDVQGIREWLGTTPLPAHPGTTVLVAGVVSRRPDPCWPGTSDRSRPGPTSSDTSTPSPSATVRCRSARWCSARSSPVSSPSSGCAECSTSSETTGEPPAPARAASGAASAGPARSPG